MALPYIVTDELKETVKLVFQFSEVDWKDVELPDQMSYNKDLAIGLLANSGLIFLEYTHLFRNQKNPELSATRTYYLHGDQRVCKELYSIKNEELHRKDRLFKECINNSLGDGETIRTRIRLSPLGLGAKNRIDDNEVTIDGLVDRVFEIDSLASESPIPIIKGFVSGATLKLRKLGGSGGI